MYEADQALLSAVDGGSSMASDVYICVLPHEV